MAATHTRGRRRGDTFRFSRFLGSRCRDEIGVKSLCTALMLPAEEPACSAQRGEQVQAAAMPSSSQATPPPSLSSPRSLHHLLVESLQQERRLRDLSIF